MPWVRMTITEYVPDDTGGMVALTLTDAQGTRWTFSERSTVVAFQSVHANTPLPSECWVECTPAYTSWLDASTETVDLSQPHGITSQEFDGVSTIVVNDADVMRREPNADQLRDEIVQAIRKAFHGVKRGGGISWSMCEAIDDWASSEEIHAAGLRDKESCWEDLIDDREWHAFPGGGGFCFIDDIGFRYYAPVVMIRMLNGKVEEGFPGHFVEYLNRFAMSHMQSHLAWTLPQMIATAKFVRFLARNEIKGYSDTGQFIKYRSSFTDGWSRLLDPDPSP